jgi:hypothetical protein
MRDMILPSPSNHRMNITQGPQSRDTVPTQRDCESINKPLGPPHGLQADSGNPPLYRPRKRVLLPFGKRGQSWLWERPEVTRSVAPAAGNVGRGCKWCVVVGVLEGAVTTEVAFGDLVPYLVYESTGHVCSATWDE